MPSRKFAGCVLVSDNESWVGTGRGGSSISFRIPFLGIRGDLDSYGNPGQNPEQKGGHEAKRRVFW
jgi:hypothetical protein